MDVQLSNGALFSRSTGRPVEVAASSEEQSTDPSERNLHTPDNVSFRQGHSGDFMKLATLTEYG